MRKKLRKLKSFSFSRVSEGTLGTFFAFPLLRFGHEIRWCFAVADASQSHAACGWQARWLQDVAKMRKKLKKLKKFSFCRVSEGALGIFLRFRCYVFGTKLGDVLLWRMRPKSHTACAWQARRLQDVANTCKKLKSFISFSSNKVSEGALGIFLGFLCYVLGTKLDGVLLLQMRPKAMQLVLGRLAGCKMWQTCVKTEKAEKFQF